LVENSRFLAGPASAELQRGRGLRFQDDSGRRGGVKGVCGLWNSVEWDISGVLPMLVSDVIMRQSVQAMVGGEECAGLKGAPGNRQIGVGG